MNKKLFNDSMSDELLAALIDDTLRFKKTAKARTIKTHLLKIVPAVAVIVIAIGIMNMLPILNFGGVIDPYTVPPPVAIEVSSEELTAVPVIIERETFESLMALVSNDRILRQLRAYYSLRDGDTPFYILMPDLADRELTLILGHFNNYIGWTDESYNNMLEKFGLAEIKNTEVARAIAIREEERARRERQREEIEANRYWQAEFSREDAARQEVLSEVKMTAGGSDVHFVLSPYGHLWGWGWNESGLLGNGTRTIVERGSIESEDGFGHNNIIENNSNWWPQLILRDVAYISASSEWQDGHAMAITTDGRLWGWGDNRFGQLGGTANIPYELVPLHIMDNVSAVSAGSGYTMIIMTDGSLWGWGQNNVGQLGDGTTEMRLEPVRIMDNVVAVSAGDSHTMAITSDGTLWGWGLGYLTGNGMEREIEIINDVWHDNSEIVASPVRIMDNVAAVSIGQVHTMAIMTDGSLWGWGMDFGGVIGGGTELEFNENDHPEWKEYWLPVHIMDDVATVLASPNSTMAITSDGSLWGWGWVFSQEVEANHYRRIPVNTPTRIMDNAVAVSSGHGDWIVTQTDSSAVMLGLLMYEQYVTDTD